MHFFVRKVGQMEAQVPQYLCQSTVIYRLKSNSCKGDNFNPVHMLPSTTKIFTFI